MDASWSGRRVTVMGLGTFGAGIAAARCCAQSGAAVTVTDLRSESALADSLEALADLPAIRFHLGGHRDSDFVETDLVIASPAVRPNSPFLRQAAAAGVPVTSEIRLFWDRCRAPIIGVTGSNGKSTTATLIRDILRADGRTVWLGGNIGGSLLSVVENVAPQDWVVLELSSFQLAGLDADRRSPHVAVITNFTPNHLDWHGSVADYAAAKQTVLRWQSPDDFAVRHPTGLDAGWPTRAKAVFCSAQDDPGRPAMRDERPGMLELPEEIARLRLDDVPGLSSPHLRLNARLAATAAVALKIRPEVVSTALQSFGGLPHRLQSVGRVAGRRFINDSASTTPESTIAAIQSLHEPLVLIVGGSEKGCELEPLALAVAARVRSAVLIGPVCARLMAQIDRCAAVLRREGRPVLLERLQTSETLSTAFEAAFEGSDTGDTILFSPGFSSGSMFRNFAERGDAFVRLVRHPIGGDPPDDARLTQEGARH